MKYCVFHLPMTLLLVGLLLQEVYFGQKLQSIGDLHFLGSIFFCLFFNVSLIPTPTHTWNYIKSEKKMKHLLGEIWNKNVPHYEVFLTLNLTLRMDTEIKTEKSCRKLIIGVVYLSPIMNKLVKIWETWKLVVKSNKGYKINMTLIKIKAPSCEISIEIPMQLYKELCKDVWNKHFMLQTWQ